MKVNHGMKKCHNCGQCWPKMTVLGNVMTVGLRNQVTVYVVTIGLRNHLMKYVVTVGLRCQCMEWPMTGLRYLKVNVLMVGLRNYNMEDVQTLGLGHYVVIFQATVFKMMWSPRHCQQG